MVMNSFAKRNFMQPMLSGCLDFFSFKAGGGRGDFYMFPNIFSIAPHSYPICLGKCGPPFTNIPGLKGRNFIHHNRTFYFKESP